RARRGRRVDLAHVVADLVGPQLGELRARPDAGSAPVARELARGAVRDGQVERLDERVRHRAGSLPAVRNAEFGVLRHAALRRRWSDGGTSTAARTRSSTSSAVMFSDSASYESTSRWRRTSG